MALTDQAAAAAAEARGFAEHAQELLTQAATGTAGAYDRARHLLDRAALSVVESEELMDAATGYPEAAGVAADLIARANAVTAAAAGS